MHVASASNEIHGATGGAIPWHQLCHHDVLLGWHFPLPYVSDHGAMHVQEVSSHDSCASFVYHSIKIMISIQRNGRHTFSRRE